MAFLRIAFLRMAFLRIAFLRMAFLRIAFLGIVFLRINFLALAILTLTILTIAFLVFVFLAIAFSSIAFVIIIIIVVVIIVVIVIIITSIRSFYYVFGDLSKTGPSISTISTKVFRKMREMMNFEKTELSRTHPAHKERGGIRLHRTRSLLSNRRECVMCPIRRGFMEKRTSCS